MDKRQVMDASELAVIVIVGALMSILLIVAACYILFQTELFKKICPCICNGGDRSSEDVSPIIIVDEDQHQGFEHHDSIFVAPQSESQLNPLERKVAEKDPEIDNGKSGCSSVNCEFGAVTGSRVSSSSAVMRESGMSSDNVAWFPELVHPVEDIEREHPTTSSETRHFYNGDKSTSQSCERLAFQSCVQRRRRMKRMKLHPFASSLLFVPGTSGMVIAVDATPKRIGGYYINEGGQFGQYYTCSSSLMPWTIYTGTIQGHPEEFELKNLLCALLLWEEVIVKEKFLTVYTDNNNINNGNNEYCRRIFRFLRHLQLCKDVRVTNPTDMYLNAVGDEERFCTYITPADSLSRGRERQFRAELAKMYGEWVKYPERMSKSLLFDLKVYSSVRSWRRRACEICGFSIGLTGSLRPLDDLALDC